MDEGKNTGTEGSYYSQVSNDDIIGHLRHLLSSGAFKLRDSDGKIEITTPAMVWDTPWHHISHDPFLDCHKWHKIMFELFSLTAREGKSFVPTACQQCWKVVVKPRTLLGLFALMNLEIELDRPSKCGIEIRPTVHGLYGGYFYNHSLEDGLECYKLVKDRVSKTLHLGTDQNGGKIDTPVILKRACTEFEAKVGASDKWEITPEQIRIETLVNRWLVSDSTMRTQPAHAIAHVHKSWIEYAYMNGDSTYLNFTGGEPLYRPYVTYHHLVDADEEEREKFFKKFQRKQIFDYV